ncbi:hypothetical protein VC83_02223 [Pseudogymnoascus destructans]|uniref:Reticulon-like protein n=2 Tax=Pseudogymnoascus destructans TaxID=655981 RepID=L8G685_PSED2|nr:uncharacterized protein VC83_02223 [Pseudogymnoascus destructans]ELR08597.1 hypothetical protein GMDG_03288 [Pseudogymnoascus destructans 20631-21]OAF61340.1 hypothetical protein VC83_02223 [Pseudogymnoascus destructans]
MSSYTDSAAYPTIPSTEGLSTGTNAANTFTNGASDASNTTTNRSSKKNDKVALAQGPVAESVKAEATKTSAELSALSAKRQTPATRTATGQPLTHYHSFFGSLFSWENPRASALAYATTVVFIFAARYLDLLRYGLKLTWMALGVTVAAEVAGRALFNAGFTAQIRPRKYYTVPKATLDSMTGDLDELINFFVIESQRLLFAENVLASGAALLSAFISYHLVKIVPLWGLALIGTSVLFLGPLVYTTNKALIDGQIEQLSQIVNAQTTQVRQMASQHASNAAATTKMYVGDYSAKAQEIIGRARSSSPADRKSAEPAVTTGVNSSKVPSTSSFSPAGTSSKKSKVPSAESFPKVPETGSFAPSTTTSSIPATTDSFTPSTTASNTIPATLPTYAIPPPGAALKTEGLSSSAADAVADLRFDDFPSAPKKVVNVGEDGLAREGVPSVAGVAAGLREEELLS